MRRWPRPVAAATLLAALVAGPPLALAATVGDPRAGWADLLAGDTSARAVLAVTAVLGWLAWARFTWCVLIEALHLVRHSPVLTDRPGLRPAQRDVTGVRTVARVLLTASIVVPATASLTAPLSAQAAATVSAPATQPATPTHSTAARDAGPVSPGAAPTRTRGLTIRAGGPGTYWDLAEQHLGAGSRWRTIWHLNRGRRQSDGSLMNSPTVLKVGWTVQIPGQHPLPGHRPVPGHRAGRPADSGPAAPRPYPHGKPQGPGTYEVAAGDWLGAIADRFLGDPTAYQRIRVLNPDLIPDATGPRGPDHLEPGWALTLPPSALDHGPRPHATGNPPAPPAKPGRPEGPTGPVPEGTPAPPARRTTPPDTIITAPSSTPGPTGSPVPAGAPTSAGPSPQPSRATPRTAPTTARPPSPTTADLDGVPPIPGPGLPLRTSPTAPAVASTSTASPSGGVARTGAPARPAHRDHVRVEGNHRRAPLGIAGRWTGLVLALGAAAATVFSLLKRRAHPRGPAALTADDQQGWAAAGPRIPGDSDAPYDVIDELDDTGDGRWVEDWDDEDVDQQPGSAVITRLRHAVREYAAHIPTHPPDMAPDMLPDLPLDMAGIPAAAQNRATPDTVATAPPPTEPSSTDASPEQIPTPCPSPREPTGGYPGSAGHGAGTETETTDRSQPPQTRVGDRATRDDVTSPPQEPTTEDRARVQLFGPPAVLNRRGHVMPPMRQHATDLLVYLAIHRGGARLPDIMEAIWPDATLRRAAARLSTEVANLRRTIRLALDDPDAQAVINTGGHYHLNPAVLDIDLWRLEDHLHQAGTTTDPRERIAHLEAAVAAHPGPPLAEGRDYAWTNADIAREKARRTGIQARLALAAALNGTEPARAAALISDAADLDPVNEDLARRAIRACVDMGDVEAGRRRLRDLRAALDEIDQEPSGETLALAAQLSASQSGD